MAVSAPSPADDRYVAHDWGAALALYAGARDADPAQAPAQALPLLIAHCGIELAADPAALPEARLPPATGSAREQALVKMLHGRALELCRAGDGGRASAVLRLLRGYDPTIAGAYRDLEMRPAVPLPAPAEPGFLRELGALPVDAIRQRHRGARVLIVQRRYFPAGGPRRLEPIHCLEVTAERFGLTPQVFTPRDGDPEALPATLLQLLSDGPPAVVLYDVMFPFAAAADGARLRDHIEAVFAIARAQLGVRVVAAHMDAWLALANGVPSLFRGLGAAFDVVQHAHPAALGIGTPEQNARTFCYGFPTIEITPTALADALPRACFAGSITPFNIARLAWWAETARRSLPIDFYESRHEDADRARSDQDYVDLFARYQLSLSLTRRAGGPKIFTGRSQDIPLAGGLLVEERSIDTDFFMTPGIHYEPFETLDELANLIPALLADPARCARVRAAGQRWARTYFTGDTFWAGLLQRLDQLR